MNGKDNIFNSLIKETSEEIKKIIKVQKEKNKRSKFRNIFSEHFFNEDKR